MLKGKQPFHPHLPLDFLIIKLSFWNWMLAAELTTL